MAAKTPPGAQLSRKQWAHLKFRLTLSTAAVSVGAMLLFSVALMSGESLEGAAAPPQRTGGCPMATRQMFRDGLKHPSLFLYSFVSEHT